MKKSSRSTEWEADQVAAKSGSLKPNAFVSIVPFSISTKLKISGFNAMNTHILSLPLRCSKANTHTRTFKDSSLRQTQLPPF